MYHKPPTFESPGKKEKAQESKSKGKKMEENGPNRLMYELKAELKFANETNPPTPAKQAEKTGTKHKPREKCK